ncbi:MAG: co-chaperone DjlA [Psittacicella sp.]
MYLGRIICTILGSLILNIPGAIGGFFIGWYLDRNIVRVAYFSNKQIYMRKATLFHMISLSITGYLAKSKGSISKSDIDYATNYINKATNVDSKQAGLRKSFNLYKESSFSIEDVLYYLNKYFQSDRFYIRRVIKEQIKYIMQENLSPDILAHLQEISLRVNISEGEFNRMVVSSMLFNGGFNFSGFANNNGFNSDEAGFDSFANFFGSQSNNYQNGNNYYQESSNMNKLDLAYELLNVTKEDDRTTIKRAYRNLMNKYHPDKLASQNLSEEELKEATKKAQDIQNAYEIICKSRGFKK